MTLEDIISFRFRALEENIAAEYRLLHDFENHLRASDNPRVMMNDREEIKRVREAIADNYQEHAAILKAFPNLGAATKARADEVKKELDQLETLSVKVDQLGRLMFMVMQAVEAQTISLDDQNTLNNLALQVLERFSAGATADETNSARQSLRSADIGMSHKLKVSIPILLNFLSYEGEISLEDKFEVKEIIAQLKEKVLAVFTRKRAA